MWHCCLSYKTKINKSITYPPGQPSIVQCLPFQPVTQRQVPFLHWPCSLQRGSHSFVLHRSPPHPSSQWHFSPMHVPCGPQSRSHSCLEQSSPLHLESHTQFWVSSSNVPWPEQSGKHWRASLSIVPQSRPFQPFLQMHVPSAQKPWPLQVGWGQSTENINFIFPLLFLNLVRTCLGKYKTQTLCI